MVVEDEIEGEASFIGMTFNSKEEVYVRYCDCAHDKKCSIRKGKQYF